MFGVQRSAISKGIASSILLVLGLVVTGVLMGCGQFFPSGNTIVSLSLSPTNATIKQSTTQQYTATATFGNNSTGDATTQVTWTSSVPNIATINSAGLATAGTTLGQTTIQAKSGSVIATTRLTVSNKTITSISINPSNTVMTSGSSQQFTATGTFSDGSTGDVTTSVSWSSSNTAVATVTSGGFVTAVSTGSTTITATSGSIAGNTQLTVQ
jgi:hypothetical protein